MRSKSRPAIKGPKTRASEAALWKVPITRPRWPVAANIDAHPIIGGWATARPTAETSSGAISSATVGWSGTRPMPTHMSARPTSIIDRSPKRATRCRMPPPWISAITSAMATRIHATCST